MQNPRLQYNIVNKDICKNSKDYVGFSYPGIVLPYTIYIFPLLHYLNMGYMFTPIKFVINDYTKTFDIVASI